MYKEVVITWRNKELYVDYGGVFGLSLIKQVTLQNIVAHDFRYGPHMCILTLRGVIVISDVSDDGRYEPLLLYGVRIRNAIMVLIL